MERLISPMSVFWYTIGQGNPLIDTHIELINTNKYEHGGEEVGGQFTAQGQESISVNWFNISVI